MKRNILFWSAIAVAFFASNEVLALSAAEDNDSTVMSIRLKELQSKRDKLQNEINVQDAKRNRQIAGVAPGRLEEMNDRQDSICLAMRSVLVDVMLEIKEISPEVSSPALLEQYNNLINKPAPTDSTSNTMTEPIPDRQPANKTEK